MMDGSGLWDVLEINFADKCCPLEEVHDCIQQTSSSVYPEFGDWMRARIDDWLAKVASDDKDDQDEEEDRPGTVH